MTEANDIESLKAELKSLYELVNDKEKAKDEREREELLSEIASLSNDLGQDFEKEDYEDAPLDSLRFNAKLLRRTLETIKQKSGNGDLAGMVNRKGSTQMTAEELEDTLTTLIAIGLGLEWDVGDEVKEQIRYERMAEGYKLR